MNGSMEMADTANYRSVASRLRKDGYTTIPEREELLASVRKVGSSDLTRWTESRLARCEGDFHGKLAFHLTDVGE